MALIHLGQGELPRLPTAAWGSDFFIGTAVKSVSAKDGYVKDNITSRISVSKSLGLYLRASIFQALSLSSIKLLIVLWCSAKTRKINLMVHYVLCLLRSEAEIGLFSK